MSPAPMATHISFDDEIAIEQFCSMFAVLIILKCAIFENNKNQEDSGFRKYCLVEVHDLKNNHFNYVKISFSIGSLKKNVNFIGCAH